MRVTLGHLGITLVSFCDFFGIVLGPFMVYGGDSGSLGRDYGTLWGHFGVTWGALRGYFTIIVASLCALWGNFSIVMNV